MRAHVPRRARRAVSRARHPRRGAERGTAGSGARALPVGVRSDRRHHQLRARPADLLRVAGARARRSADRRRDLRSRRDGSCSPPSAGRARSSTACRSRRRGTAPIGDALLVTGFPYDMHVRGPDDSWSSSGSFLHRARAVRRLGSAALDLCYVAAGRFDGFWEQHLKPWDVAAGALVVTEAGGRITGMDGGAVRRPRRPSGGVERAGARRHARGDRATAGAAALSTGRTDPQELQPAGPSGPRPSPNTLIAQALSRPRARP